MTDREYLELLQDMRDFLVSRFADARHSTEWSDQQAAELFHRTADGAMKLEREYG